MKKINFFVCVALLGVSVNSFSSVNFVDRKVTNEYSNNKVLNNEIQAIPGQEQWLGNGSSRVQNGILTGDSYWATVSNQKVDGKLVIQAILGVTATKNNQVKGGVLVPFTNIQDGKALPPLLKCIDCNGEMKNLPIIGLPIINAKLSKQKQYKGHIIDPTNGHNYKLVMWVTADGKELKGEGEFMFFNNVQTWYLIDNQLAGKCYNWFHLQPQSERTETSSKDVKDFKGFAFAGDKASSSSISSSLEALCQ